jgi:alanine-synthesizing transaminase
MDEMDFSIRLPHELALNPLSGLLKEKRRAGRPLIDLTESNPTRVGLRFSPEVFAEALAAAANAPYEPDPRGLPEARAAIAEHYGGAGTPIDPEHLHLTAGTSEGYSFLFKLLADPGDEVLVPVPSYPLLESLARLEGVCLSPYRLRYGVGQGWGLDRASFDAALSGRTRAVVAVHPNNPTGSFLSDPDRDFLLAGCADRGIPLIVDEVFLDFPLRDGPAAVSTLAAGGTGLLFVLDGCSKRLGLPQAKLAWIVTAGTPALVTEALERLDLIADTFLTVGGPIQRAAGRLLAEHPSSAARIVARCRENLAAVEALGRGSDIQPLVVEGGWSVPIRLPEETDEEAFVTHLLAERDVLVHPGYFYDFPFPGVVVVSLLPEPALFGEGIARLLEAAATLPRP